MDKTVDRIFEVLKYKKMPQKELAARLGIQKNAITRWKTGELSSYMKYLPAIAKELGTTTEYLLSGNEIYRFAGSAEAFHELMTSPQVENEIRQVQQQCEEKQKQDAEAALVKRIAQSAKARITQGEELVPSQEVRDALTRYLAQSVKDESKIPHYIRSKEPGHDDLIVKFNALSPDDQEEVLAIIETRAALTERLAQEVKERSAEENLTRGEQQFLADYRSLNPQGQEYIRQTMHMAVHMYKKSPDLSDLEGHG